MSLVSEAKQTAKRVLFRTGALPAYHRMLSGNTLTVPMFHRVLPATDPRFATADPAYTMRLDVFEQCLTLFGRYYNVVSLGDVEAAATGARPLPQRALLVTFDDGWEDTASYAVPALQKRGMPSVVFVTTGAVDAQMTLWQDVAGAVWRGYQARATDALLSAHADQPALIVWLSALDPAARDRWLSDAVRPIADVVEPLMMSRRDIRDIAARGAAIGGHGATHRPLTDIDDVAAEVGRCAEELEALTGRPARSFAFPHGRYDADAVRAVSDRGFTLIFTSDPLLNRTDSGRPLSHLIGRLDIPEHAIVQSGQFSPERLAFWLMQRPVSALPAPASRNL